MRRALFQTKSQLERAYFRNFSNLPELSMGSVKSRFEGIERRMKEKENVYGDGDHFYVEIKWK